MRERILGLITLEGIVGGEHVPSCKGHRYPIEAISHCVWLYFRFPLSFREVEVLMLQHGVIVSYETVRRWCRKFGQAYADGLRRRDKAAARRFFRRLMKKTSTVLRVIVTDRLRSYGAAHREVMPSVEHRSHRGLNNRAENSHQPTRQRERAMKGFRSVGAAQRFLAAFSGISPHFRPHRHLMTAPDHRAEMTIRFAIWDRTTGAVSRPTTA
ncbi:DDE-type integrase/transposase/recombinase [Streptomyces sp. NPDC048295]|uniref:DDE-type integrase/transposase/recombinase n=1 Tax=Streptomyces sp. NPDC048295 TaxID=3154617 RepID=UPI00344367D9